jgi:hypothetical protein
MACDEEIAGQRVICKRNSVIVKKRNRVVLLGMKWGNVENASSVEAYH